MSVRRLVHDLARVAFAVTAAVAMPNQFADPNGRERRAERSRLFDALRGAASFSITIVI